MRSDLHILSHNTTSDFNKFETEEKNTHKAINLTESMTDDMFEEKTMKFKNNLFSFVWQILCF